MTNKLKFLLMILIAAITQSQAQSPDMINYQGVAVNAAGNAISNQAISIRATVHQATANGASLYSEERLVNTDDGGLFNFQIGSQGAGTTTGSWSVINWDNGAKFLEIEMDVAGGANFTSMGTQQLVSVPYAQYASKAGALIPTATINTNQINSVGATMNQVLKYDGTNWVPAADATGLTLPYFGSDVNNESFKITNSNATNGTAIYGIASGNGTTARGIFGSAHGTNGVGVKGNATGINGIGVDGFANQPNGIAIKGTQTANGIAIKGTTGAGFAVYAECTRNSGTAVYGKSNGATGYALYGESLNGTALKAYANNAGSIAVYGSSLAGTGVKAISISGLALDVFGNVKISGGNTNPSNGAVLTSDASGNATWRNMKVGFTAGGWNPPSNTINEGVVTKLNFDAESFDASNNFNLHSAAADKSTFIAPVSGFYHFNSRCLIHIQSIVNNLDDATMYFKVNGFAASSQEFGPPDNSQISSDLHMAINEDMHLNAGDKVTVHVLQSNLTGTACTYYQTHFGGHLIFVD